MPAAIFDEIAAHWTSFGLRRPVTTA